MVVTLVNKLEPPELTLSPPPIPQPLTVLREMPMVQGAQYYPAGGYGTNPSHSAPQPPS